jgi:hypothetical protein
LNEVHPGNGGLALNAAQALKIANSLATLMKDCNANLAAALCQALSTPDKAHHYLTNLDFVKDASGCKTHFGRIPQTEFRFPPLQLFPKLAACAGTMSTGAHPFGSRIIARLPLFICTI